MVSIFDFDIRPLFSLGDAEVSHCKDWRLFPGVTIKAKSFFPSDHSVKIFMFIIPLCWLQ